MLVLTNVRIKGLIVKYSHNKQWLPKYFLIAPLLLVEIKPNSTKNSFRIDQKMTFICARSEVLQNWDEKDGGNFIGMKIDFGVDKLVFFLKLVSSYILTK